MTITTCVFDAYGTLFDVNAAARTAAAEPQGQVLAEKWPAIAQTWRLKQLEYTWLRSVAGVYEDFWHVTCQSLDYALEQHGIADGDLRARLLGLYWELGAYGEVPGMLRTLRGAGLRTAILSNGSPPMLAAAVKRAGIGDLLDGVLSVQSVGVFKPSPKVYALVARHFGCPTSEVLFCSSNCWDACAAAGYGFRAAWINRAGAPVDRLPWRPDHVLDNLDGVPSLLAIS